MDKLEIVAIDARLNALVQQRDNAMNQVVMFAGEVAKLQEELKVLREAQIGAKEAKDVPN